MRLRKHISLFILCIGSLTFGASTCLAQSAALDDEFTTAQKIESRYFTIYLQADVDIARLLHTLDIGASNQILVGGRIIQKSKPEDELALALDNLFLRCSEILDMRVSGYRGKVKVFRTHKQLAGLFRLLYGRMLPDTGASYYSPDLHTIYISEEGFKLGVVGHEMAHAIMNRYFVNSPPEKIQEVLAGYVEFQLRKQK